MLNTGRTFIHFEVSSRWFSPGQVRTKRKGGASPGFSSIWHFPAQPISLVHSRNATRTIHVSHLGTPSCLLLSSFPLRWRHSHHLDRHCHAAQSIDSIPSFQFHSELFGPQLINQISLFAVYFQPPSLGKAMNACLLESFRLQQLVGIYAIGSSLGRA